ncbi:hypothetical protein LCGC14_1593470 [marine sediment metagenome]|uniref:Uncharacterized protein n=1 Tax=marine sediment metagenome TaxID=412755 RepID=A0A0F9ID99_9ZZZZ
MARLILELDLDKEELCVDNHPNMEEISNIFQGVTDKIKKGRMGFTIRNKDGLAVGGVSIEFNKHALY